MKFWKVICLSWLNGFIWFITLSSFLCFNLIDGLQLLIKNTLSSFLEQASVLLQHMIFEDVRHTTYHFWEQLITYCEEIRCLQEKHWLFEMGKFVMSYFWFGLTAEAFAYSLCINTTPQSKHKKPFSWLCNLEKNLIEKILFYPWKIERFFVFLDFIVAFDLSLGLHFLSILRFYFELWFLRM